MSSSSCSERPRLQQCAFRFCGVSGAGQHETFSPRSPAAFRQHVSRVVEVDDLLQALEIAIVAIGLHEIRSRPLVDIAQCGNAEPTVEQRRQSLPGLVCVLWTAQKVADAEIDAPLARRIDDIAEFIRLRLLVVGRAGLPGTPKFAVVLSVNSGLCRQST